MRCFIACPVRLTGRPPRWPNIAHVLATDGVLFGATVLGRSGDHTRMGRAMLKAFNRRGVFDNLDDTEQGIADILRRSFGDVEVETLGGLLLFVASRPSYEAVRSAD